LSRFRVLVAITGLSGYLQVVLGGLVRVSGSGLGCPDWPTCYGKLYPPPTFHAIVEYTHRYNGALFGLLVIAVVAAGLWLYRDRRAPVLWLTVATLGTVVGEGLLGWQVVANLLAPALVLLHLAIALVIVGLMVAIYLLSAPPAAAPADPGFGRLALAGAALTYLMLLTGSSVVATSADLVCKSWPLCGGGFALDFSGVAGFDILHRLTVGVVTVFLVYLCLRALRSAGGAASQRRLAWLILALLAIQVALGAGVAVTSEVAWLQGAHLAVATATWAAVAALAVLGLRPAGREAEIGDHSRVTSLEGRPA
jgi:heme A synthase